MFLLFSFLSCLFVFSCAAGHGKRVSEPFRLTYFPSKGRAEKIRLLFRVTNRTADLVDTKIDSSKWPELKAKTPFGQLPILRHGQVRLAQSNAILFYVASKLGLSSYADFSQARLVSIVSALDDLHMLLKPHKTARHYDGVREELKKYAKFFEQWLAAGNDDDEKLHFVDGKLTLADVASYDMYEQNLVDFIKVDNAEETIRSEFEAPNFANLFAHVQKLAKTTSEE